MTRGERGLPRDTTRQSERLLYGDFARILNRWSGILILIYLAMHLLGQGAQALNVPFPASTFLAFFQYLPVVRAILFAAIAFHFFYGVNLIALDLGTRIDYRVSFLAILALAILTAIWQVRQYIGF